MRRLFGWDADETPEQYVRRLNGTSRAGYVTPVLAPLVELYDRIAALERRVGDLESRRGNGDR